jgi:ABC-type polar amino acid transport system ATPase subunit
VSDESPIVRAEGLTKRVGALEILRGVSFEARRSTLTAIIGPSGSGKSTVLRCLNGLELFDSGLLCVGDVTLRGVAEDGATGDRETRVRRLRRMTGMVFQQFNLFPHLRAVDNVAMAPRVVKGMDAARARAHAVELLAKVGLSDRTEHFPAQLSGGQQQRVAIARALAMEPAVLLYDEPTSALDPTLVEEVLGVMRELRTEGMTQIVVTHEMSFVRDAADQALFLDGGVVAEAGAAAEMFREPRQPRTKEFLKKFLG